ncbi:Zinc/iron permease [Bisporella sp. PMI_857]|nr:Zinc/iron permease [Bisporella sp. PMI_857]KAH8600360.1 Zinc/iron permease [Bisporella sp. PMI_857]
MADALDQTYAIEYECGSGNEFDGRLGLRISSIFVIGFGSLLGALLPIAAARTKRMRVPPLAFFITKYFGSGVIVATAFIHLLSPANANLNSPCLTGPITDYDYAQGIVLMTIFLMFFIELLAARFDVFGTSHNHDVEALDPSSDYMRQVEKHNIEQNQMQMAASPPNQVRNDLDSSENSQSYLFVPNAHERHKNDNSPGSNSISETDSGTGASKPEPGSHQTHHQSVPVRPNDFSYPPGGEDHLGHHRDHDVSDNHFAAQLTGLFILEFGVLFHSVFIGLSLAVAGDNFTVLYIVLVFHQTFEGLGLGSRLATARWPRSKKWMPWFLGTAYGFSTPIAIAIGLGVRATFSPGSQRTMIVNGVFDAISAGILIYTGLVELMAHEFMFNHEMRKSSIKMMMFAFSCMCLGAGLMAVLGKWA